MLKSESIKQIAIALNQAQAQMRPAAKDSTNPHFKSKYADLGAIWDACRDALTSNGLAVVQTPTDCGEGRVGLTTTLMHVSGEWISDTVSTRLVKDEAQGVGSALTYLRRYSLAAALGIVADEDDDGNAASRQQQSQQQQQAPAFDPEKARAAIKGLSNKVTMADIAKAAKLTDRESLTKLYNEVSAR